MHRFRKKSDAKRAQVPENLPSSNPWSQQSTIPNQSNSIPDTLPALPPASDFRTSLILPSLSRRFTLLRNSNGDPVSLDDMRSKFAEQRALGAEHQISEEEEDMIVQALGEIQAANTADTQSSNIPATSNNIASPFSPEIGSIFVTQQDAGGDSDYPGSIRSGSVASSPTVYPRSIPSSPSTSRTSSSARYSSKRNSNNLFGSGRFHDATYLRSVGKSSVGSSRSTASLAGSDSHGGSVRSTQSLREAEANSGQAFAPESGSNGDLIASNNVLPARVWSNSSFAPLSALPPRFSKEFTAQQVKRTSLALERALRGLEEEAEETIMVPRTSASRASTLNSRTQSPKLPDTPSVAGTPIPWMTDEARVDDRDEDDPVMSAAAHPYIPSTSPSPSPSPYPRPGTTSPTPRLPGYIPGMTRPLTPHDVDSDDGATGYSTTPRARSPAGQPHYSQHSNHSHSFSFSSSPSRHHRQPSLSSESQSILPPSILRRGSAQAPPLRTTSPGLGIRSRGNSVNNPQAPSPVPSPSPEERSKNDVLARRPLSPLIVTAATNVFGGSRPGTPSGGVTWPPSSPLAQVHTIAPGPSREIDSTRPYLAGHSRNGSFIGGSPTHDEPMSAVIPPSAVSLPDLSLTDGRNGSNPFPVFGSWVTTPNLLSNNGAQAVHLDSSVSSIDLGQSLNSSGPSAAGAKIAARAPTPVYSHPRSPTSGAPANGHDPILLNRSVSKRLPKRMQTPPPHIQSQIQAPMTLHTPSSSSNSSSNVNLNHYPNTTPLFSPMLNTSASSLLSVGSSYHSWADENTRKSGWDQLVEYDSQRSAWKDILHSGGVGVETDDVSETEGLANPAQVLHSITGLTKGDLATVQQKLVADALLRRGFDPPRSPTRRRRMSNSRASFSAAQSGRDSGTNSPAPPPRQATPVTDNDHSPPSPESTSRANALLDSVLNSIQSQQSTASTVTSSDAPTAEPHSTTDDDASSKLPSISSSGRESREEENSALRYKALAEAIAENDQPATDEIEPISPTSEPAQSHEEDSGEATEVPASQLWRNPPVPVPVPSNNAVELARDVSRKAAEATAALKSPSLTKVAESESAIRRRPIKRIDLQQISSPQFVSSSTSVNAIPIMHPTLTPQTPSPTPDPRASKLSQRFKKLRGSLRTKPISRDGTEVTPFMPSTTTSTSSTQTPIQRLPSPAAPTQTLLYTQQHVPPASATEHGRFKVPVPSPPASAGPGLKGFMARFRKPRRETGKEGVSSSTDRSDHQSPDSISLRSPSLERHTSPPLTAKPPRSEDQIPLSARSPTPDPATVDQFFNAASQLGLDRRALDELLARSTSTSSRNTTWTQSSTVAGFVGTRSNSTATRPPASRTRESHSLDRSRTPDPPYKPLARPNITTNRQHDSEVVRRTVIFAGDNLSSADLNGLTRKDSTSSRPQRSSSATSVHSTGSAAREPPVPRLPAGLRRSHNSKPSDSSSFYDGYPQDQLNYTDSQNGPTEGMSTVQVAGSTLTPEEQGQGPALQVLHMSNGQLIWSVIDSLRAADEEDSESLFRRSLSSSRGGDANEDMELRFKEHRRWGSKGSNYSQGSQNNSRRQTPATNGGRPDTRLFKTDSSTVGRLIEEISRNRDAGSFNFMRPATATSASTSFHSDSSGPNRQVERDLEALLKLINNPEAR
ncbi:hypothetical protein K439DRAFT_385263 [Ramaria rubella]|nr:hypothetical protein K439DRAFT_385263 [Ramaria rubella]